MKSVSRSLKNTPGKSQTKILTKFFLVLIIVIVVGVLGCCLFAPKQFRVQEINLVSSVSNYAPLTDSKLTDAWGLEFGDPGRVWLNANSGYSVAYNGTGQYIKTKIAGGSTADLAVKVPSVAGTNGETDEGAAPGAAPLTGMVFSPEKAFSGDTFVFVTEEGTISGWHPNADGTAPLQAQIKVNNYIGGAVYKGVTSAKTNQGWLLYVANFGQNSIDVFSSNYLPVHTNGFVDPTLPNGYAPFNVKAINNQIYVAYAKQSINEENDAHALGNGYIDVFTTNGTFLKRLISRGVLNSPWGMALAPNNYGDLSNYLLVGNFGDGYINVFDPNTGQFKGQVSDAQGNPLQIDGLWALTFGSNNGAGKSNELFFSSGPSTESQGVFGKLAPISQSWFEQYFHFPSEKTPSLYINPLYSYDPYSTVDQNRQDAYKQPVYFSSLPSGWSIGRSTLSKTLNGIQYGILFQYVNGNNLGPNGKFGATKLSLVKEVKTTKGTSIYIVKSLAPSYENLYTSICKPTHNSGCALGAGKGYLFVTLGTYKEGVQNIQELRPDDPNLGQIIDEFTMIIATSNM